MLAEINFSVRMSTDYTDRIWFKPDTKWFKGVKKPEINRQSQKKVPFALNRLFKLCFTKQLIQPMDYNAVLNHKPSSAVVDP